MTNAEIITVAMIGAELDPMEVDVDTFAGWKRRGFCVKKGQKAVFKTKIWKPCKFNKDADDAETSTDVDDKYADAKTPRKKLILVNASFFTDEQVEKVVKK